MPTLLVMAAGIGSRYGGLKQIDPIGPNGETIIDYSVFDAIRTGFRRLVFIIRPDIEELFREKISSKYEKQAEIHHLLQELDSSLDGFSPPSDRKKPWGTGHAVLIAKDLIDDPFTVINGDDFYGPTSFKKMADYFSGSAEKEMEEYAMVGFILRKTLSEHGHVSRGVCSCDQNNYLKKIDELTEVHKKRNAAYNIGQENKEHPLTGDEMVSMNLWGFQPSFFSYLEEQFGQFLKEHGNETKSEFYIPAVVDKLIREGEVRVRIIPTEERWFGVTYKEDKAVAVDRIKEYIAKGIYPEKLWS